MNGLGSHRRAKAKASGFAAPRRSRIVNVLIGLELLLALGALPAGLGLMIAPSEGAFLPLSLLEGTPFASYLIPGILLFTCNGLFPVAVAFAAWRGRTWSRLGHIAVGAVLIGWTVGQVILLGYLSWLQPAYFVLGSVILGAALRNAGRI